MYLLQHAVSLLKGDLPLSAFQEIRSRSSHSHITPLHDISDKSCPMGPSSYFPSKVHVHTEKVEVVEN
jgi:hypothetical protein